MSDAEFTIRLAPGLYMDSAGRFVPGPLDAVPTHPAPGGGLSINPDSVKKALSGIADALPKTGDPKSAAALIELGATEDVIAALGKIGAVAGSLAKMVPYVGAALEVAKLLGILKSGPDPVLARIEELFKDVKNLINAKDEKWTAHEVWKLRQTVLGGLVDVEEFQESLKYKPDPVDLKAKLAAMRATHRDVAEALRDLMSPSIWQSSMEGEDFKWVWAHNLFFDPGPGDPGPEHRALRPTTAVERFDHRVMAPTICAMTQSYLTFIKQIVPEYRSSGEYSSSIAKLVPLIENLAHTMREQTVARTHWYSTDFLYLYPTKPGPQLTYEPSYAGFHVGALDLRSRNVPTPTNLPYAFGWIMDQTGAPVDWGAMHFNWKPPAKIELEDWGQTARFRVLNPDECAAAANAAAEESYAAVLYASGYLSLVHLAGLLRHLYTAPSQSETVTGAVAPQRQSLARTPVTVTGVKVFPFEPATSPAEREPQTSAVRAALTTQPRERDRRFEYEVWLRTLPTRLDGTSDYATVYRTSYEDEPQEREPGTARFKRLICEFSSSQVLDGERIAKGKTPDATFSDGPKTITLSADTFDWWIPVPDALETGLHASEYLSEIRELGWLSNVGALTTGGAGGGGAAPPRPPGRVIDFDLVNAVSSPVGDGILGSEFAHASDPSPVGERREIRRADVEVTYTVVWNGIDLMVRVEGRPQDRNYDLFLVVEEQLLAHDQWLHTSFQLPITGQLTFVPERFFREEQDLIDKANAFWRDFNAHYSESVELSPLDPVAHVNWHELYSVAGLQRVAKLVQLERPEVLAAFMKERGIG